MAPVDNLDGRLDSMRLTLRTLLAYLDDILDTADADALGARVRESDFASGLVHRIRSVTGRLRLSAPAVLGRGLGSDPNTVAEYLDNTLLADRIPEFEKVCLESDMHLSEVASCHQVLALVLGEPAHVDLELRNRIHELPRIAPGDGGSGEGVSRPGSQGFDKEGVLAEGEDAAVAGRLSHRLDAPQRKTDWTQGQAAAREDSNWVEEADGHAAGVSTRSADQAFSDRSGAQGFPSWLAALAAGILIALALLIGANGILGGWRTGTDSGAAGRSDSELTQASNPLGTTGNSTSNDDWVGAPSPSTPSAFSSSDASSSDALGQRRANRPPGLDATIPVAPPLAARAANREGSPATASGSAPMAASDRTATDGRGSNFVPATSTPPGDRAAPHSHGEDNLAPPGPNGIDTEAPIATMEPADGDTDDPTAGNDEIDRSTLSEMELGDSALPMGKDLGRYASEGQLLAYWDEGNNGWMRVPDRAALVSGMQLRVPTLYRPMILLASGIQVTLNGRTDLRLDSFADERTRLVFGYGQAIFSSVGKSRHVYLSVGGDAITVTLGDSHAEFAVEVRVIRPPGDDPFADANRKHVMSIWPTSGSISVALGMEAKQSVASGKKWTYSEGRVAVRAEEKSPSWISKPARSEIDRPAIDFLASSLSADRPLTLELFEIVESERRGERRSLATRALASLGQFDPLISSFGERLPRNAWRSHYRELLAALARDAVSADRVRDAANKYWADDADRMLRMAIGYNPSDLRRFGATDLVNALADDRLEVRVMAIETLRWITGKSLYFEADRPAAQRREPFRKWNRLLESGGISYRQWPVF